MYLFHLIAFWYFTSKYYILGSILVTLILNHTLKKILLTPLIINAVCVILLGIGIYTNLITKNEIFPSIVGVYMPIVFTSGLMNIIIFCVKKIRKEKYE